MIRDLINIQAELKAPKGQYNSFGKYRYRSAEDILEAVKPILQKYGCQLTISDEVMEVGNRIYVKASAKLTDQDGNTEVVTALAREADSKKGMDESQVTGTASSYARKYALNGLFLIDDTKDADTDEYRQQSQQEQQEGPQARQQEASQGRQQSRQQSRTGRPGAVTKAFLEKHGKEKISSAEVEHLQAALKESGKTMSQALEACKVQNPLKITFTQYAALMAQMGA